MPNIGPLEIALVLIVALIILGPKKLPDMGRSVGRGMREFKEAVSGNSKDEVDVPALTAVTKDDDVVAQPVVVADPVLVAKAERERASAAA
jgi:sec-independent protein translocase protein TatA